MVTFKETARRLGLAATAFLAFACGGGGLRELIPDVPDPDEIEAFEPENMQLFFTLNLEQAQSLLKNNADTNIIDVRSAYEFAQGHLPGAFNYDAESSGFADEIATLDRGTRILIYGTADNVRGDIAIGHLKKLGFRQVNRSSAGFEEWKEAGHPFIQDLP